MKAQHVIYLSGSNVVLYTWDRTQYAAATGYELPDGNPEPLLSYLRRTPAAVIGILVDVLEEEHTRETVARLGRRDQAAMLARKLARTFQRTPYRTAALLGRAPNDPQSSQILLSGLTKAEHLGRLLEQLSDARLPVCGVWSPSLISRPLVEKLGPVNPADSTLIVSRQREGSLRLSFFRKQKLLGSRLMRRSAAASPGDMAGLLRQIEESVRYFDAAFAPSASNPVDVILLCEPGIDPALAMAQGSGHEGYRLQVPEPHAAASRLGLGGALQPANADLLFVELLRRHSPAGNFAPAADRRYFHLHQIRFFGKAASLTLAAATLLGSSLNGVALLDTSLQSQDIRNSTAELTRLLQANSGDVGNNGADPLEMQRAVTAWQELGRREVAPSAILGLVSSALERQPRIQLDGLQWTPLSALSAVVDSSDSANESQAASDGAETAPGAESNGNSNPAATVSPRVRISIRGRVEPFNGNYRAAFDELRSFLEILRTDKRVYSVTARKQPLDVNPKSTLTGEYSPATRADEATFTIDLLVRLSNDRA